MSDANEEIIAKITKQLPDKNETISKCSYLIITVYNCDYKIALSKYMLISNRY